MDRRGSEGRCGVDKPGRELSEERTMTGRSEFDDVLAIIHEVVEKIPFNNVLGLTVESLDLDRPSVKLAMRAGADRQFHPRLAARRRHLEHPGLHGGPGRVSRGAEDHAGAARAGDGRALRQDRHDRPAHRLPAAGDRRALHRYRLRAAHRGKGRRDPHGIAQRRAAAHCRRHRRLHGCLKKGLRLRRAPRCVGPRDAEIRHCSIDGAAASAEGGILFSFQGIAGRKKKNRLTSLRSYDGREVKCPRPRM
ncbi:MAG: hypothetical protein MZV70_35555 [Desulfobacterales bacterium]|nr:hypothetical protein [Desulfobacterales bacterium]